MKIPRKTNQTKIAKAKADAAQVDYDTAYYAETGFKLKPDCAVILRCRVCAHVLVPSRTKGCWYCSRALCGPLVTETIIAERLYEAGAFQCTKNALSFLRGFWFDVAAAWDSGVIKAPPL